MYFFETSFPVDARHADPFGHCRASALLGILQETGTQAAIDLHVSREEMLERYNCFWMLARIWYRLDRPLYCGKPVALRTYHRGNKGVAMYRDYDLYQEGEPVGEAVSTWVLADWNSRRMLRLSQISEIERTSGGELCKSVQLHKVRLPDAMAPAEERLLHYSDTDINGHVNNARYADLACDAIRLDRLGAGKFVSALQISFLKECKAGETLLLSAGERQGEWFVCGADRAGAERFHAALTLSEL